MAAGGTTGQVLVKSSDADYDTEWVDPQGGGGGTNIRIIEGHYTINKTVYGYSYITLENFDLASIEIKNIIDISISAKLGGSTYDSTFHGSVYYSSYGDGVYLYGDAVVDASNREYATGSIQLSQTNGFGFRINKSDGTAYDAAEPSSSAGIHIKLLEV